MVIPVVDLKLTGQNIHVLRKQSGISVRELQAIFGFATPQAIYKWQRGETLPTVENLAALAYILGVAVEDMVERIIPPLPAEGWTAIRTRCISMGRSGIRRLIR